LLLSGASVGIFPEGKVNRDPHVLLRGRLGAARLSLETGVPVVPAGLRPVSTPAGPMSIEIGAPLTPPSMAAGVDGDDVRAWHAQIMSAIAVLSGKSQRLQPKGASDEAVRADENEARPVSA
jgi:1-acyl-sn-glycerol-3-phosphate acyltransferase